MKIDNFSEEIKHQMTIPDQNIKKDNKYSLDENTPEKKNIYGDDICDVKTITEIKIPDKLVISENIIKDVCIDEGILKVDINVKEDGFKDETRDALKTVLAEKEIGIQEISDEKISLKELFHSEDRKSVEKPSNNEEAIIQNSEKDQDRHETITNRSEIVEPEQKNISTNDNVSEEIVKDEQPASISVPNRDEEQPQPQPPPLPSLDSAFRSAQPSENGIENRAEIYSDGPRITGRKSFSQNYGDTSLPRSLFESEQKGNSAHIAYSGSISMRSDSSTTSARSFAFPIMQSEWNSSPVKMAKADRRRFRRHGGWKSSIWCCGFQN